MKATKNTKEVKQQKFLAHATENYQTISVLQGLLKPILDVAVVFQNETSSTQFLRMIWTAELIWDEHIIV